MSFVTQYDDGKTQIENLDGVPWHQAPIPRKWHRCKPQTRGWIDYFTPVYRCACGGISEDGRHWEERNSRKVQYR